MDCRQVDVVSLVLHQHLSLWIRDLEEAMSAESATVNIDDEFQESLATYRLAQKLQGMGVAFGM